MRTAVSVCSGIGVGEAYLRASGFSVEVACEADPRRAEVYRDLYPDALLICGDVTEAHTRRRFMREAKDAALLISTPPCQGFSTLSGRRLLAEDPRNNLALDGFTLVALVRPAYAILENVPQMVRLFGGDLTGCLRERLPGYHVRHGILDAADFGTPQRRRRLIVLLTRRGHPIWELPRPSGRHQTLATAISHLPSLESGEQSGIPWHFAARHHPDHVARMRRTPTGQASPGGFSNSYKRMRWNEPAPTLIAGAHMISSSETVHPGRRVRGGYSDARTLTVREAMIVMGLPPEWPLPDYLSYRQAIHYLGEGLCPKVIAACVATLETT